MTPQPEETGRRKGRTVHVVLPVYDEEDRIERLLNHIDEAMEDAGIASRCRPGSRSVGVPFTRLALSHVSSWMFRLVFPTRGVKDFTCGYRAYRARVIRESFARYGEHFLDQDGFQCMVDILLKMRRMNL